MITHKILALWERFCQQINKGMKAICVYLALEQLPHLLTWLAEAPEPVLLVHTDAVNTRRGLALVQAVLAQRSCEAGRTIAAASGGNSGLIRQGDGGKKLRKKRRKRRNMEKWGIFEHATKVNIYEQTQTATARQNRKTMVTIIE